MKTIYHPTLNLSREVPEGDAEAWKAQGWRMGEPKHFDAVTATESAESAVVAAPSKGSKKP